jgi:hypothetical protein
VTLHFFRLRRFLQLSLVRNAQRARLQCVFGLSSLLSSLLKQPTITQITQLYSLIYDYLYMTIASFKLRMTKRKK